jgi:ABC-type uncharacterized transport system YnjBCD substrate-binding protein
MNYVVNQSDLRWSDYEIRDHTRINAARNRNVAIHVYGKCDSFVRSTSRSNQSRKNKMKKQNTDISEFLQSGGKIKKCPARRAKGSDDILYYSVGGLPTIKKKPSLPKHYSKKSPEWIEVEIEVPCED